MRMLGINEVNTQCATRRAARCNDVLTSRVAVSFGESTLLSGLILHTNNMRCSNTAPAR